MVGGPILLVVRLKKNSVAALKMARHRNSLVTFDNFT